MKKVMFIAFAMLVFVCPNFAQFTTVTYDLERNWFNEGQALPAEQPMVIKGIVPNSTQLLEFNILSEKRDDLLYTATWQRSDNNQFTLTVPYMLRASDSYDFQVNLFDKLSDTKRKELAADLKATLATYVEVNLTGEKNIKLLKSNKKTMNDLNEIVANRLSVYRSSVADWKPEFSDIVALKIQQLEKENLDSEYIKGDTTTTKKAVRMEKRQVIVDGLNAQLAKEVDQMLNTNLSILTNSRLVDDYRTETKDNNLSLNVGYGGVYLSGDWQDFNYGAAPYVGLAFPLGNSVLGSKLLSNTSVTMGIFLNNFEDENQNEITGLIVNRPFYLGLDHKLFQFIRVNAGATFLEGTKMVEGIPSVSKSVMIRPYVGLSARIDLSIKLGK